MFRPPGVTAGWRLDGLPPPATSPPSCRLRGVGGEQGPAEATQGSVPPRGPGAAAPGLCSLQGLPPSGTKTEPAPSEPLTLRPTDGAEHSRERPWWPQSSPEPGWGLWRGSRACSPGGHLGVSGRDPEPAHPGVSGGDLEPAHLGVSGGNPEPAHQLPRTAGPGWRGKQCQLFQWSIYCRHTKLARKGEK